MNRFKFRMYFALFIALFIHFAQTGCATSGALQDVQNSVRDLQRDVARTMRDVERTREGYQELFPGNVEICFVNATPYDLSIRIPGVEGEITLSPQSAPGTAVLDPGFGVDRIYYSVDVSAYAGTLPIARQWDDRNYRFRNRRGDAYLRCHETVEITSRIRGRSVSLRIR